MHAKTFCLFFEVFFVIWKYNSFFSFERLGRMHENKNMFFFMFWQKPGILILDLYLYDKKIQTDINQNGVKKYKGKS
jgi:hypothetical protein